MINICGIEIPDSAFEEELFLVVDHPKLKDEAEWGYSRSFMKRVGLKCDSVGWCKLKNPSTEKLKEIFSLAKEENVTVRGMYDMKLKKDFRSEWYLIDTPTIPASLDIDRPKAFTREGQSHLVIGYANYLIPSWVDVTDEVTGNFGFASFREDIKAKLEAFGFTGGKFIWIPDCGKYEAPQFYSLENEHFTSECYENNGSYGNGRESKRFETLTDTLKLINVGCKYLHITLPRGINRNLMPDCDFCGVRFNTDHCGLIISKRLRDFIVNECNVNADRFTPFLCFEDNPNDKDSPLLTTKYQDRKADGDTTEKRAEIERMWQIHIKNKKPKRVATEKLALQRLKEAKKDNPEYFGKRASAEALEQLPEKRLAPYCKVSDGGAISDEYRFLSISEMHSATETFYRDYTLENVCALPEGATAIALSADGEHILLLPDGRVIRYVTGYEEPDIEWKSLEEFFCEVI